MSVQTKWLIADRVIETTFSGDITVEDLYANDENILPMIQAGQKPIHIICDVTRVDRFPTQIVPIKKSAESYLRHNKMGWFILIGLDNKVLRFLGQVIANASGVQMRQTATLEEAFTILRKVDPTLNIPDAQSHV